jgi:hypothetical protein
LSALDIATGSPILGFVVEPDAAGAVGVLNERVESHGVEGMERTQVSSPDTTARRFSDEMEPDNLRESVADRELDCQVRCALQAFACQHDR